MRSGRPGVLLGLAACASTLLAAGPPETARQTAGGRLEITLGVCSLEAPPALRVHLERLAERAAPLLPRLEQAIGVAPAGPYRILLVPRGPIDDPEIQALDQAAPPWAAGFVLPERRVGAIRVAAADRYPYSDLASVLVHEATHMLLHDAAGGNLPRWFGEGVATGLERHWGMRDVLVYSSSLLTGPLPRLADLDAAFEGDGARARAAYAAAFDFLRATVREHGEGVVQAVVREAAVRPFPEAWRAATGVSLGQSEADWRRGSLALYRWIPALTGTGAVWGAITALAFAAMARHRARRRAILDRWEAEDHLAAGAFGPGPGPGDPGEDGQEGGTR